MERKAYRLATMLAFAMIVLFSMIPQALANDGDGVTTLDMIALVEQMKQEGKLTNERAVRALTMHLTAVGHFERQGETDKATEHMNSFILLLEHQRDSEYMTKEAYTSLKGLADAVIHHWNPFVMVNDGQMNADIMIDSTSSDLERLAASELQDAIAKISGAELPIVAGDIGGEEVSVTLPNNELNITKSGPYSFQIDVINNSGDTAHVAFSQTDQSDLQLQPLTGLELAKHTAGSVEGVLDVPASTEDGIYTIMIHPNVDGVDLASLSLTVHLDRNIIHNPGFELGMDGWYADAGVAEIDTTESYSGEHSLNMVAPGYATTFPDMAQGLQLESGGEYVMKAWMKGEAAGTATIRLRSIKLGVGDVYPQRYAHTVHIGTDWTYVELTFTHDPELDYDYNLIAFWNRNVDVGGTGKLWIDDVTLSLIEEEEEADQPDGNIIHNPSFELGMDGWYANAGITEIDTTESYSGTNSLNMVAPGYATMFPDMAQGLHLESGGEYVMKAWMKGETAGTATIRLRSMKRGIGDVYPEVYRHDVHIGTDWTYVELTFIQDPELDYDYNLIAFWNRNVDVGGTGKLWIDDVTLSLVEEEEEVDTQPDPDTGNGNDSHARTQIVLATPESYPGLSQLFADDLDFLEQSDGFAIRRMANRIYIFGSNSRGLLNGVYDFLEKNTGILWTRSSEEGTIYEPQSTILAEHVNYRDKSPFAIRGWMMAGWGGNGLHNDLKSSEMFSRNKLNAQFKTNLHIQWDIQDYGLTPVILSHNLNQWLPNEEYFDTHPEYFHFVNGQHVPNSSSTQLNFYHPDLPGVFAEKVKDLHRDRGYQYIGIGINDNQNWTQSPESEEPFTTPDGLVIEPDDPAYKSTVFFTFLNKVAAEVKETYPDVNIVSYAYFFLVEPPKVELEDNIVIVMAPVAEDIRKPLNTNDEGSRNYAYKLQLEEWVTKTKNIIMYNYYGCCFANAYERPIAERVQADAQYYRDLGIMGFLPEGVADYNRNAWGVNAMQFWLFHKLFWNPDADLEALKDEYIQKAYGNAAAPMKQYYDLIEQGWEYDQLPITIYSNESQLIGHYIIKAGIQESAQSALDEAWALADDQARARIEPIRTTFMEMVAEYGEIPDFSAEAVKTTATKDDILQSLDFSTGPWVDARPITEMLKRRTAETAPVETNVYLLWDDENLYVGYENFDDQLEEMVVSDDAPGGWWRSGADDAAETHISSSEPGSTTYAFFTNPNGVNLGFKSGPVYVPDTPFESNAIILNDRWNSVQVIPFASFGVDPQSASDFQALFVRNFHGMDGIFTWGGGDVWSPAEQNTVFLIE